MQLKNVSDDPAMLQSFLAKAAVNPLEAVRELRAAGYRVNPSAIPTPTITKRNELIARGVRADVVDSLQRRGGGIGVLEREREALSAAAALWSGDASPLAGLTKAEQVAAIHEGRSGLTELAAYERLIALDESPEASLFKQRNFAELHRQMVQAADLPAREALDEKERAAFKAVDSALQRGLTDTERAAVWRENLTREFDEARKVLDGQPVPSYSHSDSGRAR